MFPPLQLLGLPGRTPAVALLALAYLPATAQAVHPLPAEASGREVQREAPTPPPPSLHFEASGPYTHASARITTDARLWNNARLEVTLTDPSGSREVLNMDREGIRSNWTGQLLEPGAWQAEARLTGSGFAPMTARETVTVEEGAPVCSASMTVADTAVVFNAAEIVVDTCGSSATTGSIHSVYVRIQRDGAPTAALDMGGSCERSFILPGGGDYTAMATITDHRGATATCEATAGATELHPRAWPTVDIAGGLYRTNREDVREEDTDALLAGGALGLTMPLGEDRTGGLHLFGRAAGGVAHNAWFGTAVDVGLLQHTETGFFGAGAGVWGLGDPDLVDVGIFGTGGLDIPIWTRAGQAQVFTEIRLFASQISAIQEKFSAVVGLRFHLQPVHKIIGR